ncbi:MAG: NUDIX hydrolase [Chloroflexi bacterium]|nr:NUDIX hydrolase [Chloroflexota bacterium]
MHPGQAIPESVTASSSGGVVVRANRAGKTEVVICGRRSHSLWALPKGTPNAGESELETAMREVREETGLNVKGAGKIGEIHYSYYRPEDGARVDKTVHFYLMRPVGGNTAAHDPEFDVVEWVEVPEALRRLTYPNEARIVEAAVALAAKQANGHE